MIFPSNHITDISLIVKSNQVVEAPSNHITDISLEL